MLSRYDELELLAMVEGDLDDERLAADPQVRALVAAMRRDREMLQSEPEPRMPHDLAAKIEQALTRPMLIAAWGEDDPAHDPAASLAKHRASPSMRPGEFRRHHHRPARVRRIARFALAASVAVLFGGALWFGVNAALDLRGQHDRMIAQETDRAADQADAIAAADEAWPPAGSSIHHYAPRPVLERLLAGRGLAETGVVPPQPSMREPVAVEFALFLAARDRSELEGALKEVVRVRGESASLVQHMSRAEARRVLEQFQASRDPGSAAGSAAGIVPGAGATARPLAGSYALAPTFGVQLEYAVRGATHTITIRLSQLAALLEEIEQMTGAGSGALKLLPGMMADDRRAAGAAWVESRALVREAIASLKESGEDPLVHLPVVIE